MTDPSPSRFRRPLEGLLGTPATEGNHIEVLRDGEQIFPAMLDAIAAAERTVDLLTFVYWTGDIALRFADVLCERASQGVRCRVILDALGARHVDRDLVDRMRDSGVLFHWFRPFTKLSDPGHRTHRKVLICDERIGFTGGVGIAEEWDGTSDDGSGYRETQVRVEGPAVDGLRAAFADDWLDTDHPLLDERDRFPDLSGAGSSTAMVVRGESEMGRSDVAMLRHVLFELAEERVRITTAYLAPDDATIEILRRTAARGVQVQLLVPGESSDKEVARIAGENAYEPLLEAGVEIHHFTPSMLHAKVTTVDGEVGIVGSSNLNNRSMRLDEEVDLVVLDPEVVAELDAHTDADLERCDQVHLADWRERGAGKRVPQLVVGLIDRWA